MALCAIKDQNDISMQILDIVRDNLDELIDDMELLIDGDDDEDALVIAGALRLEKE